jgi:hypothetical protein
MLLVKKTNVNSKNKQDHQPIFATGTGESDTTTPFFASCGTQFIEE